MKTPARGFTLLETMVALVVLAVAALGAMGGMIAAAQDIREGQKRQDKTAIAEAREQQLLLLDKTMLLSASTTRDALLGPLGSYPSSCASTPCTPANVAIGAAPWVLDPTGAFFTVDENGQIVSVTASSVGNPASCADSALPNGTFCREVAFLKNLPDNTTPKSGTAYTIWTRVVRKGEISPASNPSLYAVVDRQVVVE